MTTDLTTPRATVAALLQDVHVLMANMQTAAERLQHWLNATATDRAVPAPVLVAPAPAAPAPAPVKRGRKPKDKHPVLEALTRMAKGWTARAEAQDLTVIVTPGHIKTLPAAKICWDIPCNTGLTSSGAAVNGRELLDVMKRAGSHATLTASADGGSLQIEGDVVVRLRAQGQFTPEACPPRPVLAQGQWDKATCAAIITASSVCSRDLTRPNLNHVLLNKGFAVATDGHRLDVRPIDHDGEALLVPALIMPVLATCEGSVSWEAGAEHISIVDADGVSFTVARGTEPFPAWRHAMPKAGNGSKTFALSIEREILHQRSKVKPTGLPHWHCHLIDNELQVEERGVDGATKFTIPVSVLERPDGDRCLPRFGLNYTYVRDMCESGDSKYITLFIEDQFTPILCSTAVAYENAVSLNDPAHVIMPVRL